jgi:hypothetical protein
VSSGINLTEQSKSVEDAVEGMVSATLHYGGKEPFNLGTAVEVRIHELLEEIRQLVGHPSEIGPFGNLGSVPRPI